MQLIALSAEVLLHLLSLPVLPPHAPHLVKGGGLKAEEGEEVEGGSAVCTERDEGSAAVCCLGGTRAARPVLCVEGVFSEPHPGD